MTITIDGTNGINAVSSGVITLAAGTTTVPPLDFTSGSLLTTPITGSVEYNGIALYHTPIGTQRGIIPGMQYFQLNSNYVGLNQSAAQSLFGVSVTLSSSTVYAFECTAILHKTSGTTTHIFRSAIGGTATLNYINYGGVSSGTTGAWTGSYFDPSINGFFANTTASIDLSTAIGTSTTADRFVQYKGTISVSTGGTFTPQYALSATPGGAYSTLAGSYFLIYPIGIAGSNTSIGTWA